VGERHGSGPDPLGFPLSSIRVFWWNQYYLYGMSEKEDHQKIRGAFLALADNNTQGLPCSKKLDKSAESIRDRNNPHQQMQQVPAGLSQLSHLPSQQNRDDDDWNFGIEDLSDTEDYGHSRKFFSRHYNDVTEAIHNSNANEALEN
jgi:hypothetical protein